MPSPARRYVSTLTIAGMPAVHAVRAVFTALAAVDGITSADVDLGRAVIEHDGRATDDALRTAIAVAGFEVTAIATARGGLPVV
jgi:copper chaperone CopZ